MLLIAVVSFIVMTAGILVYAFFLQQSETRYVIACAIAANITGSAFSVLLVAMNNPPFALAYMTSPLSIYLWNVLWKIPIAVLFSKLVPDKVEASLFAFCTCLSNTSSDIQIVMGDLICKLLFGTIVDLEDAWFIYTLQGSLMLVPLFMIGLVPRRVEVEKVQACMEYLRLHDPSSSDRQTAYQ
jgi:hypothetical protein